MRALKKLAPLAALLLTACQATIPTFGTDGWASGTVVVDTSCEVFEPIRASRTDTEFTRQQVKEFNAAWDALCTAPGSLK